MICLYDLSPTFFQHSSNVLCTGEGEFRENILTSNTPLSKFHSIILLVTDYSYLFKMPLFLNMIAPRNRFCVNKSDLIIEKGILLTKKQRVSTQKKEICV